MLHINISMAGIRIVAMAVVQVVEVEVVVVEALAQVPLELLVLIGAGAHGGARTGESQTSQSAV